MMQCKHHLLCLGLGSDCAPPISVEQLFNGEVRRTVECADTLPETIHTALDSVAPAGNGWGVRIRGSVATLEAIGAFQVVDSNAWVFEVRPGRLYACQVS